MSASLGEEVRVRADAAATIVERGDLGHLVLGQLEIEYVEVLGDARRRDRFRDRDQTILDVPAECDLRRRPAMLVGDAGDQRVLHDPALAEWAPGFGDDAVL